MSGPRFSVNIPNFGDFADHRNVVRVATAAEAAGWDGLFIWDHVVHDKAARSGQPFGDPWMLLTAAALATNRIRLGAMVTPVPRRRPQQLARQVATLDAISGGRVVFGAGIGGPIADEFGSFGEPTDPRQLADRLDEGLELIARYWSGERVEHTGPHYEAHDVELLPATVQQPRPPVWIAGVWPAKRPIRRAARWDGVVPMFEAARHGHVPSLDDLRALLDYLDAHGADRAQGYEVVLGGRTDPGRAADVIGPLMAAGATWWDERQRRDDPDLHRLAPVLARTEAGPPRL